MGVIIPRRRQQNGCHRVWKLEKIPDAGFKTAKKKSWEGRGPEVGERNQMKNEHAEKTLRIKNRGLIDKAARWISVSCLTILFMYSFVRVCAVVFYISFLLSFLLGFYSFLNHTNCFLWPSTEGTGPAILIPCRGKIFSISVLKNYLLSYYFSLHSLVLRPCILYLWILELFENLQAWVYKDFSLAFITWFF